MLGNGTCDPECNNKACTYDLGECVYVCNEGCSKCFEEGEDIYCLECIGEYYLLYNRCVNECYTGFQPITKLGIKVCEPLPDNSSIFNPSLIYVTQQALEPEVQTGVLEHPFSSFSTALSYIRNKYTHIYLLNYDDSPHLLKKLNMIDFPGSRLSKETSPLNFGSINFSDEIHILPYTCSETVVQNCYQPDQKARLLWRDLEAVEIYISSVMYIQDIEFDGYNMISQAENIIDDEYFTYCPYTSYDARTGLYYDDKGQQVTWDHASKSDCDRYKNSTLIRINYGELHLENVSFLNWRAGFFSLITGYIPFLYFTNVNFINIKSNNQPYSAIISTYECEPDSSSCGAFRYDGGIVKLLNNGYEYNDGNYFSGFIYTRGLSELRISNINFEENIVYKGKSVQYESYDNTGTLIYNENSLFFRLTDCTFSHSIIDKVIYLKILTSYKIIDKSFGFMFKDLIEIKRNTFSHIYGDIIQLYFYAKLLNVRIEYCTFQNIVYNQHLIDASLTIFDEIFYQGGMRLFFIDGYLQEVYYSQKYFLINQITIQRSYGSASLISLVNLSTLDMNSVTITESLEPYNPTSLEDLIQELVYSYLIELEQYISLPFNSNHLRADIIHSENSIYLYTIHGVAIRDLISSDNYSGMGGTDILLANVKKSFELEGITIANNTANSKTSGSGISFSNQSIDIQLYNITAFNNTNFQGYGAVYFESLENSNAMNSSILDSEFKYNTAAFGSSIAISGIHAEIRNVTFDNNSVIASYGGAIYFNPNTISKDIMLSISNCQFLRNSVKAGFGGAIAVYNSGNISGMKILFELKDSEFIENTSLQHASSIYIGNEVDLHSDSIITNCIFINNKSEKKANIFIGHRSGILTFDSCRFENNEAEQGIVIYLVSSQDSKYKPCRLMINNSIFRGNKPLKNLFASLIQVGDSLYYSTLESHGLTVKQNSGTAVNIDYGNWIDTNSTFTNNIVYESAVARISNSGNADLKGVKIYNNTSELKGGIFLLSSTSHLKVYDSIITENLSKQDGGVVFMNDESVVWFHNTHISTNQAEKGSFIYATECNMESLYIVNSRIYSNISQKGGVISLLNSILSISHSYLYSNIDASITPGIYLAFSNLTVSFTEFQYQTAEVGAGIYATSECQVSVYSCAFKYLESATTGGAIFSYYSTLDVVGSEFENIISDAGGSILAYSERKVEIRDSIFTNSTARKEGGAIKYQEGDIILSNCTFSGFNATAILADNVHSLNIDRSQFSNGTGNLGGALQCKSCRNLFISNSSFKENYASYGGALYLSTPIDSPIDSQYMLTYNNFSQNIAISGGSIYSNNINFVLYQNTFESNQAQGDSSDGNGGAVKVECYDAIKCQFKFNNNTFRENSAYRDGGAISWLHFEPILQDNIFINNEAQYGNDIASFPCKLAFACELNSSIQILNQTEQIAENFKLVAPGQTAPLILLALVDNIGQIVLTENSTLAEISSPEKRVTIYGESKKKVEKGVFNFSDYTISGLIDAKTTISIKTSKDTGKPYIKSKQFAIENEIKFSINLRECLVGEKESDGRCTTCPVETYSFDPKQGTCLACPAEARCYGGIQVTPKKGYWRANDLTDNFFECPYREACLGSPNVTYLYPTGRCAEGYTGNLCATCAKEFSKSTQETCGKCGDTIENWFKLVGIIILISTVFIIIVKSNLKSVYKPKSLQSVYIKIFFNYLQLVMLTASIDFKWPSISTDFISIQKEAGSITEQVFSYDCLISYYDASLTSEDMYFIKMIYMALLPFSIIIIAFFIWGIIAMMQQSTKPLKDEFASTVIILLFLIHPNIVRHLFSTFSCMELEPGEFWIRKQYNIQCWKDNHIFYIYRVVLPGILIWGVGIPAICLFILIKNRKNLHQLNFRLNFGFLFNGYLKKHYYWEFFILYRKILIIFCSTFLSSISVDIQALTISLMLVITFYIHQRQNPFHYKELNEMEKRSILVAMVTIYSGMYYMTEDLDHTTEIIFFVAIIFANVYFIYYWIYKMLGASAEMIQKIPILRFILHKKLFDGFQSALFVSRKSLRSGRITEYDIFRLPSYNTERVSNLILPNWRMLHDPKFLYLFIVQQKNSI
jgi:hypothetical protein